MNKIFDRLARVIDKWGKLNQIVQDKKDHI